YEDPSEMSSPRRGVHAPLRRSLSEQLRDSTARAWDLLWRNVRERRLAAELHADWGAPPLGRKAYAKGFFGSQECPQYTHTYEYGQLGVKI
ncbi:stAR-related lipid transfer protein 13 isoform X2, partial [Sigmodon hispidus]